MNFPAGASFVVWLQILDAAQYLSRTTIALEPVVPSRPVWVVHDPIVSDGVALCIKRNGDAMLPLMLVADRQIVELSAGWIVVALYTGLEPFFLLVLEHPQWGRATWFLTSGGYKIGDHVSDLSPEYRTQLAQAASALFSVSPDIELLTQSVGFSFLSLDAQRDILALINHSDPANV